MNNNCTIEICLSGNWQVAADLSLKGDTLHGHERTPVHFSYELDYGLTHLGRQDVAALSLRYPVDIADHQLPSWPPFLLDLLPTGAGRRRLCLTLGLPDGASADWDLLRRAGGPPPGNLRISSKQLESVLAHPGFTRREVVERAENFIEYCLHKGYPVGGSSAVQGESPKTLLSEDGCGRFHPSGTLPDKEVTREWLVKFPRGHTEIDRQILRAEATYYELARRIGCYTGYSLTWEDDCLFVPRFDVFPMEGKLHRLGLETMASAIGKPGFGETVSLDEFAAAIRQFSTAPLADIIELFRRDVLNVALGNTDNHSRNTCFLKGADSVRLAPLFDFAPMMVDPEWIARACRWQKHEAAGYPHWRDVVHSLASNHEDEKSLRIEMKRLLALLPKIPQWLRDAGIGTPILERCEERCHRVMEDLAEK
jgi:serine/threonine-protein kinase HipA